MGRGLASPENMEQSACKQRLKVDTLNLGRTLRFVQGRSISGEKVVEAGCRHRENRHKKEVSRAIPGLLKRRGEFLFANEVEKSSLGQGVQGKLV